MDESAAWRHEAIAQRSRSGGGLCLLSVAILAQARSGSSLASRGCGPTHARTLGWRKRVYSLPGEGPDCHFGSYARPTRPKNNRLPNGKNFCRQKSTLVTLILMQQALSKTLPIGITQHTHGILYLWRWLYEHNMVPANRINNCSSIPSVDSHPKKL